MYAFESDITARMKFSETKGQIYRKQLSDRYHLHAERGVLTTPRGFNETTLRTHVTDRAMSTKIPGYSGYVAATGGATSTSFIASTGGRLRGCRTVTDVMREDKREPAV